MLVKFGLSWLFYAACRLAYVQYVILVQVLFVTKINVINSESFGLGITNDGYKIRRNSRFVTITSINRSPEEIGF